MAKKKRAADDVFAPATTPRRAVSRIDLYFTFDLPPRAYAVFNMDLDKEQVVLPPAFSEWLEGERLRIASTFLEGASPLQLRDMKAD